MQKLRWQAVAYSLLVSTLCGCSLWPQQDKAGAWVAENLPWWEVSQGWRDNQRKQFWFISQGSRLIPYDWFLHLEQAENKDLFRADTHIEKLRYIPAPADEKWNPEGLPIGLARGSRDDSGTRWLGPTCAFCHTAKINLSGTPVVVDGAPTLGDFEAFNHALIDALLATWSTEDKFQRFSNKVLGSDATTAQINNLKGKMQLQTQVLAEKFERNKAKHAYGYGRLDAVGAIFNEILTQALKVPDNWYAADAPVSYPFLWGASQSSVVQWNGLAPNNRAGFGPLMRNVGEVLGVYGVVDVVNRSGDEYLKAQDSLEDHLKKASKLGYKSSINIKNLGKIEKLIKNLRSPKWPSNLLPPPDSDKVARGAKIYHKRCVGCHAVVTREKEHENYQPKMIKVSKVGTDAKMADNFLMATNKRTNQPWHSGKLEGTHSAIIAGKRYAETLPTTIDGKPTSPRGEALVTTGIGAILGHPGETIKAAFRSFSDAKKEKAFDPRSYKARPLTGIWATAPYLHNGSAPNLFEVISDPKDRSKTFYLGNRVFDPVKVGYSPQALPDSFLFDTRLEGNRNTGHPFGRGLTDTERYDVVEYLKTL